MNLHNKPHQCAAAGRPCRAALLRVMSHEVQIDMKKWLEEVEASLTEGIEALRIGEIPAQNLYMIAPLIYSKRNNMNNDALVQQMVDENEEQVQRDWASDERSKNQYKFHYVASYLFCFVVAGKIEERKYDEIMEYVTSKMDLFTDDYGIE